MEVSQKTEAGKVIHWNRPMLKRLKVAHSRAVSEGRETFTFDGNEFVSGYAKYLIEYLDGTLWN